VKGEETPTVPRIWCNPISKLPSYARNLADWFSVVIEIVPPRVWIPGRIFLFPGIENQEM